MTNRPITRFWLLGGISVVLLQVLLFILLAIASKLSLVPGLGIVCGVIIFIAAFAQIPPVALGRALQLPIETGEGPLYFAA